MYLRMIMGGDSDRITMKMKTRMRSLIDRLVPLPEYVSAELLKVNARLGFAF